MWGEGEGGGNKERMRERGSEKEGRKRGWSEGGERGEEKGVGGGEGGKRWGGKRGGGREGRERRRGKRKGGGKKRRGRSYGYGLHFLLSSLQALLPLGRVWPLNVAFPRFKMADSSSKMLLMSSGLNPITSMDSCNWICILVRVCGYNGILWGVHCGCVVTLVYCGCAVTLVYCGCVVTLVYCGVCGYTGVLWGVWLHWCTVVCMCMCVCACVYMYVCMSVHVCVHVCMHECMLVCMCMCVYACAYVCRSAHVHVHVCVMSGCACILKSVTLRAHVLSSVVSVQYMHMSCDEYHCEVVCMHACGGLGDKNIHDLL